MWASPTSLIGFQRAVVLEHFDPYLAAAVADSAGIYTDPSGRLDRTLAYFLTVAVADGRTAVGVSDALMRIHARAKGIEPITGSRYSANNPEAQLWIHVTGWHSVLKCYERYGPGPLSAAEREAVLGRVARRGRTADVQARRCPRLTRRGAAVFRRRARTGCALPNTPTAHALPALHTTRPRRAAVGGQPGTCAGGHRDPAEVDAAHGQLRPAGRGGRRRDSCRAGMVKALSTNEFRPMLAVARRISPETAEVLARTSSAGPPAQPRTVTPAEVRERLVAHA